MFVRLDEEPPTRPTFVGVMITLLVIMGLGITGLILIPLVLIVFPVVLIVLSIRSVFVRRSAYKRLSDKRLVDQETVFIQSGDGRPSHVGIRSNTSPSIVRVLLEKARQQEQSIQLQSIGGGLYVNVSAPRAFEILLNAVLPAIARECFYGDITENYRLQVLPALVAKLGPSRGYLAARRWLRKEAGCEIARLVWYQLKTLLFTNAAWHPLGFKKRGESKNAEKSAK